MQKEFRNKPDSDVTFMKFSANSTDVSFNTCLALTASVNSVNQTLITGTNLTNGKPGSSDFEVEILHDVSTLKAGQTYPLATVGGQADASALFYFTNETDSFNTLPLNPSGTVTITDVTSTTVKGTFSGKLYAFGDEQATNVIYTITNGSFTAKISN
jgi:hypothetical protein